MFAVNTTFESALLVSLARDAVTRCDGKGDFEAITAVLLAYTAFEAFVNELGQLAETLVYEAHHHEDNPMLDGHPETLVNLLRPLAVEMRALNLERASTEDRYDSAWKHLAGAGPDRGRGPRQELTILTRLRNGLAHMQSEQTHISFETAGTRPEGFEGIWLGMATEGHSEPRFIPDLVRRGLVAKETQGQRWVDRILSRKLAEWACLTVEHSAEALVSQAPAGSAFRLRLEEQALRHRRD